MEDRINLENYFTKKTTKKNSMNPYLKKKMFLQNSKQQQQ
jgi:hypothetical protein